MTGPSHRTTPPTILVWNDDYDMAPTVAPECGQPFRLSFDRACLPEATAVVFHAPTLGAHPTPDRKPPGQRWVAWSMESDVHAPASVDPALGHLFDLRMTYERSADVWAPYLPVGDYPAHDALAALHAWRAAGDLAPIVYVGSNPATATGRDVGARALMLHLPVDSYGASLRNRSWGEDRGRPTVLETMARYPFTFAVENSVAVDYVTEKFFDPLLVGSVPVYLGAPNIAELAPGADCFVDIRDHAGPRELAAHLLELAHDDEAYLGLHRWRDRGPTPAYQALAATVAVHPFCRLATILATS